MGSGRMRDRWQSGIGWQLRFELEADGRRSAAAAFSHLPPCSHRSALASLGGRSGNGLQLLGIGYLGSAEGQARRRGQSRLVSFGP